MGHQLLAVFILGLALVAAEQSGLSTSATTRERALESSWGAELQPVSDETKVVKKQSPIQRVVKLLNEMKAQLEKEAEEDEELYDKMVCWCETMEKEKTKAIADAEAKDKDLTAEIEERAAKHGVLSTEIEQTKKELEEEKVALAEATGLREKEAGEFMGEEKDLVQAIMNVKNAIQVLSKVHGGSLLQLGDKVLYSLKTVLQDVGSKHEVLRADDKLTRQSLHTVLITMGMDLQRVSDGQLQTSSEMRGLRGALDAYNHVAASSELPEKYAARVLAHYVRDTPMATVFVQRDTSNAVPSGGSYAPASDQIFGILNQMKEDFETNLAASQKNEKKGGEDYVGLKATKEEMIAASEEKRDDLLQQHAENKKALFDAKEDLELTRNQRTADVKYLQGLQTTCNDLDKQWAERSKMRSEEIKAVTETIAIVTDDDARDLMSKTVTLLQESLQTTAAERMLRSRASTVLKRMLQAPDFDDLLDAWHGRRGSSDTPRNQIAMLAVSVQLDAFTKVKEAMDAMVAELKEQQKEDAKLKEWCTKEFNENEKQTYVKTEEKNDLEEQIESLSALIEKLTKEIDEATQTIADTKIEIKKASESREKENADFQTTVADQRATQTILKKALKRLEAFYKKKALLQQREDPVPPVQFKPMKKNAGASPVISMLEQIIEESKAVETEAIAAEKSAQSDYEKLVKDSNDIIKDLTDAVTEKTKGRAQADSEKVQTEADHKAALTELESLNAYKADLHEQCDFILKNFDLRAKARMQEMEAISEAKAILSGAGR